MHCTGRLTLADLVKPGEDGHQVDGMIVPAETEVLGGGAPRHGGKAGSL